jgi:TPR repeat protein
VSNGHKQKQNGKQKRKIIKIITSCRGRLTGMMMGCAEETTEEEEVAAADMMCCASCGTAAVDDVKLKKCACNLVKYCSIACQKDHRSKHKSLCKKQLAELRDKDLFEQPDSSHWGECPICCLPLPLDEAKNTINDCCSKIICNGCYFANMKREIEAGLERRCAFCRESAAVTDEEANKRCMKRIKENNDPAAMWHMGKKRYREGDCNGAVEYWTKAAELGDAHAHYELSCIYREGEGVEKDMKKYKYHSEEAAIGGHVDARNNLGCIEADKGRFERAKKHWIIAAILGNQVSLKNLRQLYKDGHASKEDYADALRAYQAAVDATKSKEREEAEEALNKVRK